MDTEILFICLKLSCPFYCQDPVDLGWEPYVKSWLWKTSKIMHKSGVDCLEFMIKNSVTDGLQFIKKASEISAISCAGHNSRYNPLQNS